MIRFLPLLFTLFFGSSLYAASSPYMGLMLEGGYDWLSQERSKEDDPSINPAVYGAKINLGIDSGDDLRTNIFFSTHYFDKDIYEYDQGSSHKLLYGVGFDILKSYSERGSSTAPYLKGGMSYEFMPIDGYAQSWANNVALLFGFGMLTRMSDSMELQLGMYYKYRMWGNYNLDTELTKNVELSDHSVMIDLGFNFHY